MKTTLHILVLFVVLVPFQRPAYADDFGAVVRIQDKSWVRLRDANTSELAAKTGCTVLDAGEPRVLERAWTGAISPENVRLFGLDGSCDGSLGKARLVCLWDPAGQTSDYAEYDQLCSPWFLAAPVNECQGNYAVAWIAPARRQPVVRVLEPTSEEKKLLLQAEKMALAGLKGIEPTDRGPPKRTRHTGYIWRVGSSSYAVVEASNIYDVNHYGDLPLETARSVLRRSPDGKQTTILPAHPSDQGSLTWNLIFAGDFNRDGKEKLVYAGPCGGAAIISPNASPAGISLLAQPCKTLGGLRDGPSSWTAWGASAETASSTGPRACSEKQGSAAEAAPWRGPGR